MTDNKPIQSSLNLNFRPAYGREDFLVGESNRVAVLSIDSWPNWGPFPFMVVYGEEGSGKRHLAAVWQEKSHAEILDVKSFEEIDTAELGQRLPNLIIHQLHLLLGDRKSEEKLFHLYNSYLSTEARILLTSRKSPSSLEFLIPDLKSRILGSQMVAIGHPDDDLLSLVLAKQLHDNGFQPSDEILRYALERMDRSWPGVKKLSGILNTLSLEQHKPLTKALVREALIRLEPEP